MKERLVIKNFGPIKEADLTFGRFNVLIGEQATGKSTVAKLLAVCRYFSYLLPLGNELNVPFYDGLVAWGLEESIEFGKTEISYTCEHYLFEAKSTLSPEFDSQKKEGQIQWADFKIDLVPLSSDFEKLLEEFKDIVSNSIGLFDHITPSYWRIPNSFYQNDVANVLDNPFYLPTERGLQSIFSLGKTSIQNISDTLFNQFAKLDQIARLFKDETAIAPLGIVYKNVNGHGFIRKKDEEKFYSLYNAASGYQATIPIVLLAKYYIDIRKKKKTFVIEEPELNLFPAAQNELMKFLVDKTMNYGNSMLIATHSPYILTALNNMIFAAQTGKQKPEAASHVLDKKYWIGSEDVSAYRMLSDGTCKSIIDEETGLIKAEELDEVSNGINQTFDQLAEVAYGE